VCFGFKNFLKVYNKCKLVWVCLNLLHNTIYNLFIEIINYLLEIQFIEPRIMVIVTIIQRVKLIIDHTVIIITGHR